MLFFLPAMSLITVTRTKGEEDAKSLFDRERQDLSQTCMLDIRTNESPASDTGKRIKENGYLASGAKQKTSVREFQLHRLCFLCERV